MNRRIYALESFEQRNLMTAQMVLDVNSEDIGVNPSFTTSFKDQIYFAANVGEMPEAEIWKSDGTVDGTQFVASLGLGEIIRMTALDDRLVVVVEIAGDNRVSTTGLFSSDGTQQGTVELVRTLDFENPFSTSLSELVISDGQAIIRAGNAADNDTENFHTVYSTDGTVEGTQRLEASDDVGVAAISTYAPNVLNPILEPANRLTKNLIVVGDRLFFTGSAASGTDADVGNELWEVDPGGTSSPVADLNPGTASSSPSQLVAQDGNLFFVADDGNGRGVWVLTDGSSSPTRLANADRSTELIVTQDGLLFSTDAEDGNSSIVSRVDASLMVLPAGEVPPDHDNLGWFADSLVYTRPSEDGQVLEYRTDTELVSVAIGDKPDEFFVHGDLLVFTSTTANGRELWTFDGNQVVELDTPFRSGSITTDFEYPDFFSVVAAEGESNGKVILGFVEGAGRELTELENPPGRFTLDTLVTDGTAEGTRRIGSQRMGGWFGSVSHEVDGEIFLTDGWLSTVPWSLAAEATSWRGSSFEELEAADDRFSIDDSLVLSFQGEPVSPTELIESRYPLAATSHGDYFLKGQDQSSVRSDEQPYAELLVRRSGMTEPAFTAEQLSQLGITSMPQNRNLLTGTPAGRMFAANDLIYFVAGTEKFGRELWQSDGTLDGTKMVRDIFPGPRSSGAELLGVSGDTLFLMANDGVHGRELWSVTVDETFSEEPLIGDLDENGEVDFADFLAFSQAFGQRAEPDESVPSDFDGNGTVDFVDFLLLSANFGKRANRN